MARVCVGLVAAATKEAGPATIDPSGTVVVLAAEKSLRRNPRKRALVVEVRPQVPAGRGS